MKSARLLAIGDVHGYSRALDALLDSVAPRDEDTLIFLGDYVDRGPDSRGVIERLIALSARPHFVALRGNHDNGCCAHAQNGIGGSCGPSLSATKHWILMAP